jgi:nitroreductase
MPELDLTTSDIVIDAMATSRAIRRYLPDPVPDEVLERLIFAATRAPSPRNTQPWEFIVVRDQDIRNRIGDALEPRAAEIEAVIPRLSTEAKQRMYQGAADLLRALRNAPVIVFVAGWHRDFGPEFPAEETMLTALHAAAENLLVAARAYGLGAAFTTFHLHAQEEVRAAIGAPDDLHIAVTIPVGFPERGVGPVRRRPVDEVLHWDRYQPAT